MTVLLGMVVPAVAAVVVMSVCWHVSKRQDDWYDQRFDEIAARVDWYE